MTEKDITTARAKRDEEWAAAYSRLGQEPPQQPVEDVYDGRSLAEKLAANKAAKQEEWEERNKLSNQFRALEEDEVQFLDTMVEEQEEEERKRKLKDGEDLREYRQAVAARLTSEQENPIGVNPTQLNPNPQRGKAVSSKPMAARKKTALKGVQVKRKPTAQQKSPDTTDIPSSPKRSKIENHS